MSIINDNAFPYFIGKIPFYYTSLSTLHNTSELVDALNFEIDYNQFTGAIIQKYDEQTQCLLNKAYNYGSQITGYMDDYELGNEYAKDFLEFIKRNEEKISGTKILEIGCGTGFLLSLLKDLGADVLGIEPGNQADFGLSKYNINIIKDYYPSQKVKEKFDIIIFYNVLEHISNVEFFLLNVKNQLKENGRVYFAVPDCEEPIKHGDISMLIHEHYNYFINESLYNTFIKYMNNVTKIEKSQFGSELYGSLINNNFSNKILELECIYKKDFNYLEKIIKNTVIFKKFFIDIFKNNKTLGIYVPSRAINILLLNKHNIDLNKIEFIDDNKHLQGKYLPGFEKIIKSREELFNKPTDYLLIMSYTFGNVIKENISRQLTNKTKVIKIEELLGV